MQKKEETTNYIVITWSRRKANFKSLSIHPQRSLWWTYTYESTHTRGMTLFTNANDHFKRQIWWTEKKTFSRPSNWQHCCCQSAPCALSFGLKPLCILKHTHTQHALCAAPKTWSRGFTQTNKFEPLETETMTD